MAKSKYATLFNGMIKEELIAHKLDALFSSNKIPEIVKIENFVHDSATDDYFHPSMHTSMDARQLFFAFNPKYKDSLIKRPRAYLDIITPYMGTSVHAIVQQTLIENGILPASDVEVSLVDEEHHWKGHMDLVYKGIPVDIKTMNPRMFDILKIPYVKYEEQLNCYMDKYPDAPYGILLVFEMGYPFRIKEFKIKRNTEMLEKIYKKWDYVRECILMDTPPSLCCGLIGDKFDSCAARLICQQVD